MRTHRIFLAAWPLLLLCACATVGHGDRRSALYFGAVRVDSDAQASVTKVKLSSVGLWIDNGDPISPGAGLGWRQRDQVAVSKDCRVVLILDGKPQPEVAQFIEKLLTERRDLCAVRP